MTQKDFLSKLLLKNKEAIIVGSLGTIAKDLDSIPHRYKIPVRGAMGMSMSVALGVALNTERKVISVIGDGSFLMKMGSMSTILRHKPKNLSIYILNNNCYASTGGQDINFKYVAQYIPKYFKIIKL